MANSSQVIDDYFLMYVPLAHLSYSSCMSSINNVSRESTMVSPMPPKLSTPSLLMGLSSSKPHACLSYACHVYLAAARICSALPCAYSSPSSSPGSTQRPSADDAVTCS